VLTVRNAANDSVSSQIVVTGVAAASCTGISLAATAGAVTKGTSATIQETGAIVGSAVVTNNRTSATQTVGSNGSVTTVPLLTLSSPYTFSIAVSNGLSDTNSSLTCPSTAVVTVVDAPSIASFTTSYVSVNSLGAATYVLKATFAGGSGVVTYSGGGPTGISSGTPVNVTLTANTTYTLTVSNVATPVVTATASTTATLAGTLSVGAPTAPEYARFGSAALLAYGKALFAYGSAASTGTNPFATGFTETNTGSASTTTPLSSIGRFNPAVVQTFKGTILVVGGAASNLGETVDASPATPTFTTLASTMNVPHNSTTSVELMNGVIGILCGGTVGTETELFDPGAGTFAAITPVMVLARQTGCASAVFESNARFGQVLVVGGGVGGNSIEAVTMTGAATSAAYPSGYPGVGSDLYFPTATALPNGKILVVGGSTANSAGTALTNAVLVDGGNTVAVAGKGPGGLLPGNMSVARFHHTATLMANGKVLIVGGANSLGLIQSIEVYDPVSDTFSAAPALASGRSLHTATVQQDGSVLIAGGGVASLSEVYTP